MQTTDTVLMIEPIAFEFNEQTAENNYFQEEQTHINVQQKALQEFRNFVEELRSHGINVITVKDSPDPHSPDSIFPNNWVSFGHDGMVVLYPMFAPNRRVERRPTVLDEIINAGFAINEIVDISNYENENQFLEGTGSIIFDHEHRIAYGSISLRLNEELFLEYCERFQYRPVVFHSFQTYEGQRLPIYHTNVMMSVGEEFVIICLDAIDDETERNNVVKNIESTAKGIIEITEEQMHHFAGNMLQLRNKEGEKFLVMSESAYQSLSKEQISQIEMHCKIIHSDLSTIETNGGGSARCMLAEVFLPKL